MPISKKNRRLQFIVSLEDARKIMEEARRRDKTISKYLKDIFIGRRR